MVTLMLLIALSNLIFYSSEKDLAWVILFVGLALVHKLEQLRVAINSTQDTEK